MTPHNWTTSLAGIAEGLANRMRLSGQRRQHERLLYLVALVIFLAAFVLSYRTLPSVSLEWWWFLITAAATAVILFTNGLEYHIAGRVLKHRIGLSEAFDVSILSSAANLLPIPGAVLVRAQALKLKGSGYGRAFTSTGAIGAGWLGTALTLAGLILLPSGRVVLGITFVLAGIIALALMTALVRLAGGSLAVNCLLIVSVEVVFVLLSAVRVYASLHGIGVDASVTQAIALTVAAALANAAGIFPGGMGLREVIAGALSPLIGLPIAAGVLSAAVDRLIGLIVLALATLTVIAVKKTDGRTTEADGG